MRQEEHILVIPLQRVGEFQNFADKLGLDLSSCIDHYGGLELIRFLRVNDIPFKVHKETQQWIENAAEQLGLTDDPRRMQADYIVKQMYGADYWTETFTTYKRLV